MIKVYNSLTKQKENFKPAEDNSVKIYTCGVTTYDNCHIGHGRSLYVFDVIRRYLGYRGYQVDFIRNITDIDDKIINKSRQLKIPWEEVSAKYIESYRQDLEKLGIKPANFEPKATDNIPDMISYIEKLLSEKYAYKTDSGIYFQVRKFKNYGRLSGQRIDDMRKSTRIEADEKKRDPLDFALWKISGDDEPGWMSPWGRGRPGWHIECSVMSQKYLGKKTIDIHGGGRDLIFPHHENECAQAECLSGKNLANYWLHHGLLTIEGQKMSKSLGNFLTLASVLEKYPASALKLFYLQAHYSSTIDFSRERIGQAERSWRKIEALYEKLENYLKEKDKPDEFSSDLDGHILSYREKFIAAMDDDFNMPRGLAVLFELVNQAKMVLADGKKGQSQILFGFKSLLDEITEVFGLNFSRKTLSGISQREIEKLIALRNQHRQKQQFLKADQIRDQLAARGIILEDSKDKTIWHKK